MDITDKNDVSEEKKHTALFAWGSTVNGQLGLGGIEEDIVLSPRRVGTTFDKECSVSKLACGRTHTVAVLHNGTIYSCGNNDKGQLGHSMSCTKFEQIIALRAHFVVDAACGHSHTLAVNEAGQVFAWGNNAHGQLGLAIDDDMVDTPKLIKKLATQHTVQVVCGANHSLALTESGMLYVWGQNSHGQLGLGTRGGFENHPTLVLTLSSLPIAQIAAGDWHSAALSVRGALFMWGKNTFGQLGLNDEADRSIPILLKSLKSQRIRYISCGEEHTAALTKEGGVFTFGAGMYGQLGHGSNNNEILPRRVLELMGSTVTQVSCGRCHTLAYVPSRGRLYAFGLGGSGQLGTGKTNNRTSPAPISGPWVNHCTELMPAIDCGPIVPLPAALNRASSPLKTEHISSLSGQSTDGLITTTNNWSASPDPIIEDPDSESKKECSTPVAHSSVEIKDLDDLSTQDTTPFVIHEIVTGGDQSFVIATRFDDKVLPFDHRIPRPSSQIITVRNRILEQAKLVSEEECVPQDIMSYLEVVFSSSACLNASYFPDSEELCSSSSPAVDMSTAFDTFHHIEEAPNPTVAELIGSCLEKSVFPHLPSSPSDPEAMRLYMFLPMCHLFHNPKEYLSAIIVPYAESVIRLTQEYSCLLDVWWSKLKVQHFRNLIQIYKTSVKYILNNLKPSGETRSSVKHEQLWLSLEVLAKLNKISKENDEIVPYNEFYIPDISESIDVGYDYATWMDLNKGQRQGKLFFCDYPFVFDAKAKTIILQTDSALQMQMAVNNVHRQNLASLFLPLVSPENPYLVLEVTRQNLVQDAINQLITRNSAELKKPLKVIFSGEDAVDAGGVRKEFFMLLLREVLNPQYGMFTEYPETHCIWFHPQTFEDDVMFYLIGLICGLAIYNFTIIDLPFPLVLYKKLLKEQIRVEDLRGLSPTLAKSLQDLLQYEDDDIEEVFLLTFEISVEVYGEMKHYELKPGGKDIPVTKENREEYVRLYINFILNESVDKNFQSFSDGLLKVCGTRVLELFQSQELMALVIGNEDYDWYELEKNAEYKNGYTKDHTAIKRFWKVFHSLTEEEKKKFLLFLTGSVRIPIQGMKAVQIIIQPMNVADDHLPVAHTCFNVLDLPYYTTEDILREKLLQAIQHTQGFGLA